VEDHHSNSPRHNIVDPNNNECVAVTKLHDTVPSIPNNIANIACASVTMGHEIVPAPNNNANPVLRPASPQELLRSQDKELENEQNDNSEDEWCTDSNDDSFVDTTQLLEADRNEAVVNHNDKEPSHSPISQLDLRQAATVPINVVDGKFDMSVQTPDRVAKDMEFLIIGCIQVVLKKIIRNSMSHYALNMIINMIINFH
jgi:hypothetical protein